MNSFDWIEKVIKMLLLLLVKNYLSTYIDSAHLIKIKLMIEFKTPFFKRETFCCNNK